VDIDVANAGDNARHRVRSPLLIIAVTGVACVVILAIVAPFIWTNDATRSYGAPFASPTSAHLFGTDALGRDVLARVLVASRLSVELSALATTIGVGLGLFVGTIGAVVGARVGRLVATGVNALVAFPTLLLAIFLAVIVGVGEKGAVLAIGLSIVPHFARLTQTLALSIAGRNYVLAARAAGVGRFRLLYRHILPNIGDPLAINAMLTASGAMLSFAGLSFLGLGVQPPQFDWGRLLNEGLDRIYVNPVAALGPAVAVTFAGISFALVGESLAARLAHRPSASSMAWPLSANPAPTPIPPQRTAGTTPDGLESTESPRPVLLVRRLRVGFPSKRGMVEPVDRVSFDVGAGETVGIVGESGSGKSLTALAVAGLVPPPGQVRADAIVLDGTNLIRNGRLARLSADLKTFLGTSITMVFQNPMTSLNPALRVGRQVAEVAEVHQNLSRAQARQRAITRLRDVWIARPEQRARQYPHELSGGMQQRAMIAMGLMMTPRLVIADEPTTALDVRAQAQVLRLLRAVRDDVGTALLLISHDVAIVSTMCDRVLVMYAGSIVEELSTRDLLSGAAHPYTADLIASTLTIDADCDRPLPTIPGRPPEPAQRPVGCAYAARCSFADATCLERRPELTEVAFGHRVACWHPRSLTTNSPLRKAEPGSD
jgi:peptide/nickel transport system permease protein